MKGSSMVRVIFMAACLMAAGMATATDFSRTEVIAYHDDAANWVLGQTSKVTVDGVVSTEIGYSSMAQPNVIKSFGAVMQTLTYNADGTVATVADGKGNTTTASNWRRGIPQAVGNADGTSRSAVVDDLGQITSVTDESGFKTSYSYDAMGRLAGAIYPTEPNLAYNALSVTFQQVGFGEHGLPAGHWTQVRRLGNQQVTTYFDALWRPVLEERMDTGDVNGSLSQVVTRYDALGQMLFQSYPARGVTSYLSTPPGIWTTYDPLGRVTSVARDSESGQLTTTTQYLAGNRVVVTDPLNHQTTTTFQAFDAPNYELATLVQAPDGINQAIVRDSFGSPQSIRQYGSYNGLTKDLTKYLYYDSYHRLCRMVEPESGSTLIHYDAAGNVDWTADGLTISGSDCAQSSVVDAAKTTRTYDAMNRVKTLVPPAGTQSTQYTYDARGNVQAAVSGMSTWSSTRNALGLITSETLQITGQSTWTLGYAYDTNGSLSSITYPDDSVVAYAPDALGRPTRAGSYATGVSYFPNGDVSAFTFGNGTLYAAQQNTRQLLSNFSYAKGSTLSVSEDYIYDNNANITQVNDLAGGPRTKSFHYDDLNRLISATAANLWGTESYIYDPLNNIASRTTPGATVAYNYNGLNQLIGLSDGTTFGYDNRGNVTNKNGVVLTFDAKNQLQNVGGSVAYAYDASGRRVSKTQTGGDATYYFYSQAGQLMYQWEPGSAKATDYVYLGKRLLARNETYITQIIGNIDGVNIDGSGQATILGWACSTNLSPSITVHFYAGGPAGSGTAIGAYSANQASEPAVGNACHANGTSYRFSIPISNATRTQYAGKAIYIHGISPVGQDNSLISKSGTYLVPVPAEDGAPTITSPVNGSGNSTGAYTVVWSAITGADTYTLQEHVDGGSWATIQATSVTSKAIAGKDDGTYAYRAQACTSDGCGPWSTVISITVLLPPAAPASITVPATSSGSVNVNWAATGTATSYTLQQRLNGGAWSNVYGGSGTGTTISESTTGSYTFQVQACNGGGCSDWKGSSAVAVTIPPASAPPLSAPSSNNTGSYTVSWTGVSGATSYTLQEQVSGGGWTTVQSGGSGAWGATGHGNGTYGYRVQACNVGGCGPWSATTNTTVLLPPPTPASISVPGTSTGSVAVSWAASSTATSYTLQQRLGSGSWSTVYAGAAISSTATATATGTYTYQVQACNGGGCSAWRASSAVAVTIPPSSAPTLSVPSNSTTGSYTVSWTGVGGATSYTLQEQTNGGGWTTAQTGSATSKAVGGKGSGSYGYRVQACNAGGCSPWSSSHSINVLLPPSTPSGLVATLYITTDPDLRPPRRYQIEASWSAVPWASSYDMYHCESNGNCGTRTVTTNSVPAQLVGGATVSVKVRACNTTGCSAWSADVVPRTVNE